VEKHNRKANMTFQQSFSLCKRRRPVVDPIPAFVDQLKKYEKECREWGYLTAVDEVDAKDKFIPSSGVKRQVDDETDASDQNETKKKSKIAASPAMPANPKPISIGPSAKPSIGSSIGPSKPPDSDASNDKKEPQTSDVSQKKGRMIGPARPPN
jgi:hypothetical protein